MKKCFIGAALAVVLGGLVVVPVGATEMNLLDDRFAVEWPVLVTVVRPSDNGKAAITVKNNQKDEVLGFDQFEIYRVKDGLDRGLAGWGLSADKKEFLISEEDRVGRPLQPGEERRFEVEYELLPITGAGDVYIQIGWRHPTLGGERKAWFQYDECLAESGREEGTQCELTVDSRGGLKYVWMKEEVCGSWKGVREQEGYGFWEEGYGPPASEGDGACGDGIGVAENSEGVVDGGIRGVDTLPLVPLTGVMEGDGARVVEQWTAGAIVLVGAVWVSWYFLAYRRREERMGSV